MRILLAHNYYQQRGGEDAVFENETAMLEQAGHEVRRLTVRNDHIQGLASKIGAAFSILRNRSSLKTVNEALLSFRPDIFHVHNFFPTLTPAIIMLAARQGVPVVLTLHNYRPLCANAMLMRCGEPCEACLGGSRWPGIRYRCYRGSAIGSACVGLIGPYLKKLLARYPRFITLVALTDFAKSRYLADGFPASSIVVRGNTMADPGEGLSIRNHRFLFVGRLSEEKGAETLIQAVKGTGIGLDIVGDGPLRKHLESLAGPNVTFHGKLAPVQTLEFVKSALALLIPSRWYEGFPMVVLEAMATGTPVLASRIGSLAEIVKDGETGVLVDPRDSNGWRRGMFYMLEEKDSMKSMGQNARRVYLDSHSSTDALKTLLAIYAHALEVRG